MASSFPIISSLLLFLFLSPSSAAPPKPKALLLPVSKDPATSQYVTRIRQRTPAVLLRLVVDLGGRYTWTDCDKPYVSSTFSPVACKAPECRAAFSAACEGCAGPARPGCNSNACGTSPDNRFIGLSTTGELSKDAVAFQTTDGRTPLRALTTVPSVTFSCAPTTLLKGLARGAAGVAAFGRTGVALPAQLTAARGLPKKFSVCLPSGRSDGVIFVGDAGAYEFQYRKVISTKSFVYTPLVLNPGSTAGSFFAGEPSADYFINLKSFAINGKNVSLNQKLLSISKKGNGGTMISTVTRYTTMESSIYKALIGAYTKEFHGMKWVAPVAPFGACLDGKSLGSTRLGPGLPPIEVVLENARWGIAGFNLVVEAKPGVMCLAFVDGGHNPRTSIIIGGHQLENNFLHFDLGKKRVAFTGSLLGLQTSCSNFNFTAAAA